MARRPAARTWPARADTVVAAGLAVATFAPLYAAAWLRARMLAGSYDLGYFRQAAWLITHGRAPFITVRGLNVLGDRFSPVFFPMALLTAPFPDVPALLFVQSAALALGVVPLWFLCRRVAGLGPWPSLGVVVAYALFPALHNANLFDFHPEVATVPALLGAVLFARTGRWWPYAAC